LPCGGMRSLEHTRNSNTSRAGADSLHGRALKGAHAGRRHPVRRGLEPNELAESVASLPGAPFLEHLLEVTSHRNIGVRRVVLGAHAAPITKAVDLKADEIVINHEWEKGQLSSIQAALRSLPPGTDGMLLLPDRSSVDQQRARSGLIEQFYKAAKPIVLPVYEGRRGHPVIFPLRCTTNCSAHRLKTGARAVVWAHSSEIEEFQTNEEGCGPELERSGDVKQGNREEGLAAGRREILEQRATASAASCAPWNVAGGRRPTYRKEIPQ